MSGSKLFYILLGTLLAIYSFLLFLPIMNLPSSRKLPTLEWAPGYDLSNTRFNKVRIVPYAGNHFRNPAIIIQGYPLSKKNSIPRGKPSQTFKSY